MFEHYFRFYRVELGAGLELSFQPDVKAHRGLSPARPGHSEALVVTGHIPSASKSKVPEDSV